MKTLIATLFLIASLGSNAQTSPFFGTVKVEYEKTVYTQQLFKEIDPEWYDEIKDRIPAANVSYYDFIGDSTQSLYISGREVKNNSRSFMDISSTKNQVYQNYKSGVSTSLKQVFEETFLVEDSLARIQWRLTSDTRTIAGFECRKAVGILDDSIGVFAFYTDELMISGGPESIHGLPGLILGMGIPRLHATWFATKVEVNGVNLGLVKSPVSKAKKINKLTLYQQLDKVLKNWGKHGSKMIVNFII